MKWKDRRKNSNVEESQGHVSGGRIFARIGMGGIILLLFLIFIGADPLSFLGSSQVNLTSTVPYKEAADEKDLEEFVTDVVADTEDVWTHVFEENGMTYEHPRLVLYTDDVESACGTQYAAVGPFYCQSDESLYIDVSFFEKLRDNYGVSGDFAIAYVIAHEVGHHVQALLGTDEQLGTVRLTASVSEYNDYSIRLELQADYYAGVWAHHVHQAGLFYAGDFDEAIEAASEMGDNRLQMEKLGYIVPESFTHGSSKQRMSWFKRGFDLGTMEDGDTFNATDL